MSRLTSIGTAESVSRDQLFTHERGLGKFHFSSAADHDQGLATLPGCSIPCYKSRPYTYSTRLFKHDVSGVTTCLNCLLCIPAEKVLSFPSPGPHDQYGSWCRDRPLALCLSFFHFPLRLCPRFLRSSLEHMPEDEPKAIRDGDD